MSGTLTYNATFEGVPIEITTDAQGDITLASDGTFTQSQIGDLNAEIAQGALDVTLDAVGDTPAEPVAFTSVEFGIESYTGGQLYYRGTEYGTTVFTDPLALNFTYNATFEGAPIEVSIANGLISIDSAGTLTEQQRGDLAVATDVLSGATVAITFDATSNTPEYTELISLKTLNFIEMDGNVVVDGQYLGETPLPNPAPCFVRGTRLAGIDGIDLAVEDVQPGDTLTLATGGTAEVVWVGRRRVTDTDVIRFLAGSLGDGLPVRELQVSCDHAMFLDGVLVQAELLENKETILRERRSIAEFFHIELDQHGILLAEGAPAESYLDTGNRRQFSNCPMAWREDLAAYCEPCAEMVFAGARLDVIRARLRAIVMA